MAKPNKQMIIGYCVLGLGAVVLLCFMFIGSKAQKNEFGIDIDRDSTSLYSSKIAAYKAKNKEENKIVRPLVSDYAKRAEEDNTPQSPEEPATLLPAGPSPAIERTPQVKNENIEAIRQKQQQATMNNEEYDMVKEDIQSLYGNGGSTTGTRSNSKTNSNSHKTTPAAEPQLTDKERRKQAIEQGWGQTSASSAKVAQIGTYKAVIHGSQSVKTGQTATFRTSEEITVNNLTIPKNTILTGVVKAAENRLIVTISSVRINKDIYPLNIVVYGTDGLAGIPLSVNTTARQAGDASTQSAASQANSTLRSVGGVAGQMAGSVVTAVGSVVRREGNTIVNLVDNQTILLKVD